MTARFERLLLVDHLILVGLLSAVSLFLFPSHTDAIVANKRSVLEIKNINLNTTSEPITLPSVDEINNFIFNKDDNSQPTATQTIQIVTVTPVPVTPPPAPAALAAKKVTKPAQVKTASNIPPKVAATEKVYMHEPELREYLCPKMGADKCEIFIAILKGENGTHECTRDNRGLNKNGSIDVGLAQINWNPSSPYTIEQLRDCKFNLDIALKKYESRGFKPWVAYTSGKYKKHLKQTATAVTAAVIN
jgi:hypothetical protein